MFTFFCHICCPLVILCACYNVCQIQARNKTCLVKETKADFLPGRKMFNTQGDAYSTDTLSDTLPLGRIAQG